MTREQKRRRRRLAKRNPNLTSWGPGGAPTPLLLAVGVVNVGLALWVIVPEWQARKDQIGKPCHAAGIFGPYCEYPQQDPSPFLSTLKNSPVSDLALLLGTGVLIYAAVRR